MASSRPLTPARFVLTTFLSMALASSALAAARSPQVPVSGTALATFFAAQGQAIAVNSQQLDLQRTSVPASTGFGMRTFVGASVSHGIYNAAAIAPALYQVYPGAATMGWFAVASFRTGPQRLIVNLLDASNTLQGQSTFLGADNTDFGFYEAGPGGTFYSQDARNASGNARMLAFNGTGAFAGSTWLCTETGTGPGGDFADIITFVDLSLAPVPTRASSWSRVKQLFR